MALSLDKVIVLSVLLCSSFTVFSDVHPPAPAPAPHHHKGGHHHHHPRTPPPSHPPVKPPTSTPPPAKPPTHTTPIAKPPTATPPTAHPPVKPPSPPPPAKPPTATPPPAKPTPPPAKPSPPPVKPPTTPPLPSRKAVAVQGVVYCKSCKYRGIGTLMGASPLAGAVVKLQCNNTKWGLIEQTKTDKNGYFLFKPAKLTTAAFHKCKVFLISSPLAKCSVPTNMGSGASGAMLIPSRKPPAKPLPFQLFTVGPFSFEPAKKLPCHP